VETSISAAWPRRFNLYGDLSCAENLDFYADVYQSQAGAAGSEKERCCSFAPMTEFRKRRAAQLSGGMQKKLALACTLIPPSRRLSSDEPTTGVDSGEPASSGYPDDLHLQGVYHLVSTPYMRGRRLLAGGLSTGARS